MERSTEELVRLGEDIDAARAELAARERAERARAETERIKAETDARPDVQAYRRYTALRAREDVRGHLIREAVARRDKALKEVHETYKAEIAAAWREYPSPQLSREELELSRPHRG